MKFCRLVVEKYLRIHLQIISLTIKTVNKMKKVILISSMFVAVLSFGACNAQTEKATVETTKVNETTPKESTTISGTTSIKNMDKNAERTKMIKKRRAELEKLTPIDEAKFKSWAPETLGDLKRTSMEFKTSPVKGEVNYWNEGNGKTVEINIFDGAGDDGSFRFGGEANYTGLEKEGFEEKIGGAEVYQVRKRAGEYSGEHYYQSDNSSKISTIVEDRYIISASGNKMSTDELWKYIESMNFKDLK